MATIKSFTSIEQSRKLAEFLPLESADMEYLAIKETGKLVGGIPFVKDDSEVEDSAYSHIYDRIACWSLAALLEQLPYELCDDDGYSTYLQINKDDDMYQLIYEDPSEIFESIETDRYEHFVDACVAMIEKLHELNLL